jgi:hypothetical protein
MLGLEHVDAACERAGAIGESKIEQLLPVNESPCDLPHLLPRRNGQGAGQVDAAAAEFNEQHALNSLEKLLADGGFSEVTMGTVTNDVRFADGLLFAS